MSFQAFDLSDYIRALEHFKASQAQAVIQNWGSIENFDLLIRKIKEDEDHVATLAIQQFGSIEKYTEAMKRNLEHFSEKMEQWHANIPSEMRAKDHFRALASHKWEAVASEPVQSIVKEILTGARAAAPDLPAGSAENHCRTVIGLYSNDYLSRIVDAKYGEGSSEYIRNAFRYYCDHNG